MERGGSVTASPARRGKRAASPEGLVRGVVVAASAAAFALANAIAGLLLLDRLERADRVARGRLGEESLERNRVAAVLALAVGAVFHAHERSLDFGEAIACVITEPYVALESCRLGRVILDVADRVVGDRALRDREQTRAFGNEQRAELFELRSFQVRRHALQR